MDMISFGPTIRNPHSPDERLYIPSVPKVWEFLLALLASFRQDPKANTKR
jgi:dipeptidase D